ncbi:uncharacterized protein LOC116178162 [Photinus pyralis]|uniref:uncharacterized protein LOC116178162 n=1 Tax=Photinus pyralis TaxID=7054 RepID=UPI001267278D|nr:uncharacterized protein LOC116178162 [Photinus pyralis]
MEMWKNAVLWLLVLFVFQVSLSLTSEKSTLECMQELNIDESALSAIYDEKFHFVLGNEDTFKFLECCLRKIPFFDKDGEFDRAFAIEQLGEGVRLVANGKIGDDKVPELSERWFDLCKGKKGEALPKRMAAYHNCVMTELETYIK